MRAVGSFARPIPLLFLDHDGGWGGSSRSLFYLVISLDRSAFKAIVCTRKDGPTRQRYEALGVSCIHMSGLPVFRPADRKNLVAFVLFLWALRRLPSLYATARKIKAEHGIALIHVNHESLALFGHLLARLLGVPWIAHIRTTLTPGWFARRLCRMIVKKSAHVICIVEPVRQHFLGLAGKLPKSAKVSVIHNILPELSASTPPSPIFAQPPDRLRVLSLTNFSPNRGVDRIVEVAEILHRRAERQFAFYLCGRPANTHAITGRVDPYYDSIREKVRAAGLDDVVFFPGHLSEPESALVACDCLIKLTRQSNPWGRDIMEALAAGLPIVTLGTFQGFVENAVNGYVAVEYRPEDIADYLLSLASAPTLRHVIGAANKAKAERLFSASRCARATEGVYRSVMSVESSTSGASKSCAA